jgi:hypothetical protein
VRQALPVGLHLVHQPPVPRPPQAHPADGRTHRAGPQPVQPRSAWLHAFRVGAPRDAGPDCDARH